MKRWLSFVAVALCVGAFTGCDQLAGIGAPILETDGGARDEAGVDGGPADGSPDATLAEAGSDDAGSDATLQDVVTADVMSTSEGGEPCSASSTCPIGQACNVTSHQCTPACSSSQPCNGTCCNGATCASPETATACGAPETMCTSCVGSDGGAACIASSGTCGCNTSTDCPQGEACDRTTNACTTACNDSTQLCNGGCCAGAGEDGGTGLCTNGLAQATCGNTGGACETCVGASVGSACVQGASGGSCGCNTASTDCPPNVTCSSTRTCETTCSPTVACSGGCCQLNAAGTAGTCVGGTTPAACGDEGSACLSCTGNAPACLPKLTTGPCGCTADSQCPTYQACVNGQCGTTCTGTCNGTCCVLAGGASSGTCATAPGTGTAADGACGASGTCAVCTGTNTPVCSAAGACECTADSQCPQNEACVNGACSDSCIETCNGGCCSAGTCVTGTGSANDATCGASGTACTSCSGSTPVCSATGGCTCSPTSCPAGQACDASGQCVCNAASCPNGCCNASAQCIAPAAETTSACGAVGTTCTACSTGLVCEIVSTGCADPNWAEWPVPNSLNDTSSTPAAPNPESYTDNGDGTILDNLTDLMWQKTPTANGTTFPTFIWANAPSYCTSLTLANHNDWRLPTIMELASIVNYDTNGGPYINATYFPATPSVSPEGPSGDVGFWSSTPVPSSTTGTPVDAWAIDFGIGNVYDHAVTVAGNVRCVR